MKFVLYFTLCLSSLSSAANNLDYLRITMGPKLERFTLNTESQIELLPHLDFSAGIYLGKNINEKFGLEMGLIRNDYSAKIRVQVPGVNGEEDRVFFDGYIYPTLRTYQMAVLPSYRQYISSKVQVYGMAGLQFFLTRKLDREGTEIIDEAIVDQNGSVVSRYEITTFGNTTEAGNFLLRMDAGFIFSIKSYLHIDASFQIKGSTLPINSFKIQYPDSKNAIREVTVETKGLSYGLNLGLRLDLGA